MRVLHINTSDWGGGAAIAGYRLHTALRNAGISSAMLVGKRILSDDDIREFKAATDLRARIVRRVRQEAIARFGDRQKSFVPGYEAFSDCRSPYGLEVLEQLDSPDIINLHWIAGLIDYHAFFSSIPSKIPVVWTVHDMNPFTGGCHYDHECGKYKHNCGACPQLGSSDPFDFSRKNWVRKAMAFEKVAVDRLCLAAPSNWMAERIKESRLLGRFPVCVIPNGIDTEIFSPKDRRCSRQILGIPEDAKVVLFVADSISNRRKGMPLLLEAFDTMKGVHGLFLVTVGRSSVPTPASVPCLNLGVVSNHRLLPVIYSAADLFVIPSLQDNLPNTVIEAMACGTPVVGFNVGGIPDMVREGVTGHLVLPGDVVALGEAITGVLRDSKRQKEMSAQCRLQAEEKYSLRRQALEYMKLYKGII